MRELAAIHVQKVRQGKIATLVIDIEHDRTSQTIELYPLDATK